MAGKRLRPHAFKEGLQNTLRTAQEILRFSRLNISPLVMGSKAFAVPLVLLHAASFGVRRLGRAFGRRLVAVKRKGTLHFIREPLDAALLGRQAGQATKAASSRRTPKLRVRSRQFAVKVSAVSSAPASKSPGPPSVPHPPSCSAGRGRAHCPCRLPVARV